ncbi:MAG: hypothetical protein B7Z52_05300 [Burkholderiales bacterium 12-64-5]|nr:MAG: hypothetical protein B7Z52_05300 [Burkholderiales bacterium 12-64-5]
MALILVGLLVLASPIALPQTVQVPVSLWQKLILDPFWKQVTGYTLVGVAALSTLLSLRKRTSWLKQWTFPTLRLVHVVLAATALGMLIVHCGYHRGSNLNLALFTTFVLASLTGGVVGVVAGLEAQLPFPVRALRRPLTLWHICCLWPLPVLIAFHIVSVYWL